MNIETKYNIGDRVWVVYEQHLYTDSYKGPSGEISVFSDKIVNIIVGKDEILYEVDTDGIDWIKEDDVITCEDTVSLIAKIKELDSIIVKREESKE